MACGKQKKEKIVQQTDQQLELGQPILHQVNVLQHEPSALLRQMRQVGSGPVLLALAHRQVDQLAVRDAVVAFPRTILHPGGGVHAREQQEENGCGCRRVLQHRVQRKFFRLDIEAAQLLTHVAGHGARDAVRPHGFEQHQQRYVVAFDLVVRLGQLERLGRLMIEPLTSTKRPRYE